MQVVRHHHERIQVDLTTDVGRSQPFRLNNASKLIQIDNTVYDLSKQAMLLVGKIVTK